MTDLCEYNDDSECSKTDEISEPPTLTHKCSSSKSKCCNSIKKCSDMVGRMAEVLQQSKLKSNQKEEKADETSAIAYLVKNNIMKRTLNMGSPNIPPECKAHGGGIAYPQQTKFIFNYRIRDPDFPDVFLDDTKVYGKKMELYSGKSFQIEFWEHCLGTMLIGEVASFMVPARCLLAFPSVNKKLRDFMLGKSEGADGVSKHQCGFMSLQEQGGLGYSDLNSLYASPKPLEFIFELITVILPSESRKDSWLMTADEKAKVVPDLREEGNKLYASGSWFAAAAKYEEALGLLEQLSLLEKPGDAEYAAIEQLRIPFFVNMAQCQYKLKDYYGSINSASEALKRAPDNAKAIFRRAMAYSMCSDLEAAEVDFQLLLKISPTMKSVVAKELLQIDAKRKACKEEERRRLAGKLFS